MRKKFAKVGTMLAITASLTLAAPVAANAAVVETAKIVPMACGVRTEYRWNDFQCWQIFTGSAPSWCWYRVYSCS